LLSLGELYNGSIVKRPDRYGNVAVVVVAT
jgi:hypothetical protein